MNTIRRVIEKRSPRTSEINDATDSLIFEAESGKFYIQMDHSGRLEGRQSVSIGLDPEEAQLLYKSLSLYLK